MGNECVMPCVCMRAHEFMRSPLLIQLIESMCRGRYEFKVRWDSEEK